MYPNWSLTMGNLGRHRLLEPPCRSFAGSREGSSGQVRPEAPSLSPVVSRDWDAGRP